MVLGTDPVLHPDGQTDQRIEPESSGNLEFPISPPDRKQLAAAGQKQEEQDPQNRKGFLHVNVHPARKRKTADSETGRKWPNCCAGESDQRSNSCQEPARQSRAKWT